MLDWLMPAAHAAEGATAATGGFWSSQIFLIAALGFAWYFMLFRPHLKRQKEQKELLGGLKKGDKVITIGGMHGVVQAVHETTVVIRVDDNCKLEFNKSAVAQVNPEGKLADKDDKQK